MTDRSQQGPRLAAGPWWLLYSGPIRPTEPHAHGAAKLVVHSGGHCVAVGGTASPGPIVVIPPDVLHCVTDHRDHVLVVHVSPESYAGGQLARDAVDTGDSLDRADPVAHIVGDLRMSNWSQADEVIRRVLEHLDGIDDWHHRPWRRHRAIDEGLLGLPDDIAVDDIDLARLADQIGLPAARISDTLTGDLGGSLSGYVRWLRLITAIESLAHGTDLRSAAEAAHYPTADALTRAATTMFGLEPTRLVQLGTWLAAP